LYDDAISKLKLSLEHFSKQDNYKQKIAVFNLIGNCFLMKSEKNSSMIDSAMMNSAISHYNQALELAETNEDLKQQAIVKQNLSEAYLKYNQPEMAKQQLIQALELNADLRDKIYLSLATVYGKEKLIDSAVYFAGLSLELFHEKNDTAALYTNYRLLSRLERQNGNYKKALEYYQKSDKCRTSILNKTGKYNLPEKEQQYTIDLLKNKNNTLFIRIILAAITILVLFCAIFALCVYFNRKIKRIKDSADAKEVILAKTQNDLEDARAKLSETNELLLESKSENVEIKVILANTQSEASETKTALLNQLETQEKSFSELQVTHKLTLNENEKLQKSFAENEQKWHNESVQVTELKQLLHEETNCKKQITKFYKMIFELEENPSQTISIKELSSKIFVTGKWETIYMLHRTLFDEIKQNFKVFDKNDKNKKTVEEYFQILCLICIDYSNTTIAYIVISTANTIQMKKGDIARLLGINAPKFIKSHVLQILNNRFE
jgi:tetratricopeptide (TPR) repeat protein